MFEKKELPGLIAIEFKKYTERLDNMKLIVESIAMKYAEFDARITSIEGTVKLMKAHHDKFTVEILNKVLLLEKRCK